MRILHPDHSLSNFKKVRKEVKGFKEEYREAKKNYQPTDKEIKALKLADDMKGVGKKMTIWITLPILIILFLLFLLS